MHQYQITAKRKTRGRERRWWNAPQPRRLIN